MTPNSARSLWTIFTTIVVVGFAGLAGRLRERGAPARRGVRRQVRRWHVEGRGIPVRLRA